ncbi:Phox homologous domain-containing protein [Halteromyces radiatus]|uniref:Phox homologous domain-containing protein n=1 Tax=Halteromyces radiatus TaxID=101107 RepID=UPI00221F6560|nr:Phox homologous domain-containing protein [Halteromyces radiatus]KAI8098601.1 Phox homologous domain-containing protein [Halteromyces radiatus]
MNREDDKMEQKQVANKQQRPPEISIFNSPFSQSRFTARPSPSSSTPWTSTIHQESTIREFQALSIGEAPSPPEDPLSSSNEYGAARLSKSNSSLSMYSLPSNVIDAPSPHQTRMELTRQKQPQTVEEIPEIRNERRSKLNIPLFKNISSSYSSPVPGALAQINFYKNDNDTDDNKIFASDAVVSHPLRIGVGYGSYICYSCTVFSNKGAPITIRKRYSDFVDIRQQLIKRYPNMKSIPKLPPKKLVKKFDPTFIEQRRRDLEYFFKYIVLHPNLGSSSIVKQWIAP